VLFSKSDFLQQHVEELPGQSQSKKLKPVPKVGKSVGKSAQAAARIWAGNLSINRSLTKGWHQSPRGVNLCLTWSRPQFVKSQHDLRLGVKKSKLI
jgi:hypothetical protein